MRTCGRFIFTRFSWGPCYVYGSIATINVASVSNAGTVKSKTHSRAPRPVRALLDLLGRRWVLRIFWELRGGPLSFRPLQQACGGVSPTVLNARLAELRSRGLVELTAEGYSLTPMGEELSRELGRLTSWAERWSRAIERAG